MKNAVTLIAESVAKAVGVAGVEAMALRNVILSVWEPLAVELGDNIERACFDYVRGEVRPENAAGILAAYRVSMGSDFIEQVLPHLEELVGAAWENGRNHLLQNTLRGVFKNDRNLAQMGKRLVESKSLATVGKDELPESIVASLAQITGSQKRNVEKTIYRWFKQTQGEYFERYIIPETERLLSYAQEMEGNIDTLNSIGRRYKEFVRAEAYWSSISEYNMESAKIFSQVQTLNELKINNYTIEAVLDEKTCPVCQFMHGSQWSTESAVEKVYDLLIAEADNASEINPFPGRSTPQDYDTPEESPYNLPPYHPRCRCNVVADSTVMLAPTGLDQIAPDVAVKPPSSRLLVGVFNNHILKTNAKDIAKHFDADLVASRLVREMTGAEYKRTRDAFKSIPFELRKWARDNKEVYQIAAIADEAKISSRVYGNTILINEKYLAKGMGPEVIQHELRHALINKQVIAMRGGARGAETLYDAMKEAKFRMPVHVNQMYRVNGGRGALAASAATDEFLAMIGDYYKQGMSFDELVAAVRQRGLGIQVEKKLGSGSISLSTSTYWSAKEAKKAVQMWWDWMDVEDLTLLSKKQLIAKLSHKPSSAIVQQIAYDNELRLNTILSSSGIKKTAQLGDNEPFDVWIGGNAQRWYVNRAKTHRPKHVIEVKSIIRAKNDKITMHPESLARKKLELKRMGKGTKAHTVVFDERTGKIYYREGLGSFRLSTMQEVSESELQKLFGGKPQLTELSPTTISSTEFKLITNEREFEKFKEAMEKVNPKHRDYLTWYTWDEYSEKGTSLYLAANGEAGYGIDPDGTLISLFSVEGSHGAGRLAIEDALARGASKLECFDGKLPEIYSQFGFTTVERYPWVEEYAPKNWDYDAFGRPDFLEMRKAPIGKVDTALLNKMEDWEFTPFPLSDSEEAATRAIIELNTWFEERNNYNFILDMRDLPPRSQIILVNKIGKEFERLQNTYDGLKWRWMTENGINIERIQFQHTDHIRKVKFGRRTLYNNPTSDSKGLYIPLEAIDPDTGLKLPQNAIVVAVDEYDLALMQQTDDLVLGDLIAGKGWFHVADLTPETIFHHELGHSIHHMIQSTPQYYRHNNKWKSIYRRLKSSDDLATKVSVYGDTNIDEAFAECFAAYIHPDYGKKYRLPVYVESYFEDLLGKPNTNKMILEASEEVEKISQYPIIRESNITTKEKLDEADGAGINDSFIIMAKDKPEGRPVKYLYKPVEGEAWKAIDAADDFEKLFYERYGRNAFMREYGYDPHALVRETIPEKVGASLSEREILSYELSKKLDLAYVDLPDTRAVYDEAGDMIGVAVKWNEQADMDWLYSRGGRVSEGEYFDVAVFDYLIGNTDRHPKNWMRQKGTQRMLLIDHGYSFPDADNTAALSAVDEFRCFPLHRLEDSDTPLDFMVDDDYKDKIVQNLLDLDIGDLASRYNLSYGQEIAFTRRRDELVLMIRESMMHDYFSSYAHQARFRMDGFGEFDVDMMPEEINVEAYMSVE